ncbi:MAG: M1 family metallopeptidase [Polyangiales bacterium]
MPKATARVSPQSRTQKKATKKSAKAGKAARGAAVIKAKTKAKKAVKAKASVAKRNAAAPKGGTGLAFRLDGSLRARSYDLFIDVDPSRGSRYTGRVELTAELTEEASRLALHAADLEISHAEVSVRKRNPTTQVAQVALHPESETISLSVAEPLAPGKITITLEFAGKLRTDLRGLYGARSGERSYAFSQLEAADARRFFPCLDEPDQKATYTVSVRTASNNTVISNNPLDRTEVHEDGTKTDFFSETPPLSTYLVALAVGELSCSAPVYAGDVPIRIVHVPGSEEMTEFALDAARETLTRLSEYFALPYPYAKLDLVAVPDFEIGAMENAGAVFFRETLLLIDDASVSLTEKKRAAEVICHELAHMWYGNLVTMRWWDDLWLNEAFATWMAFDIVAKWRPEWKMWNDFGHARNSALQLDALDNTHPIYTEVRTPGEASENFDLITYEKGAAVVRMLERYLGPKVFQRGVRRYIKRHRESNTVASDLWQALSEAAGENVEAVVRPFIEQSGFPLIRITREARGGVHSVRLAQERFDARGPQAPKNAKKKASPDRPWPVPWVGRIGVGKASAARSQLERQLLKKPADKIKLARDARYVYGNADEGGFFRPLHAASDLPALIEAFPELAASERLGFVQHQWALVRAGYADLKDFLPLSAALAHEPDADVLRAIIGPLDHLLDDVARSAGEKVHAQLQAYVIETFGPALEALGWDAGDDESDGERLRRAELTQLVAVLGESVAASDAIEERFVRYMDDRSAIDPNLIAPVLSVAARRADADRLDQLLDASEHDATPQARRRFRLAVSDVRDPRLASSLLLACLSQRIPTQDVAFVVARLLRNPYVQELAFTFMQERWADLRERVPSMLMSRLIEATPALRTEAHRRTLQQFFAEHPLPTAARALRQADERFRLDAAFRKRATPALRTFLKTRPDVS